MTPSWSVVVPTVGRASLEALLESLGAQVNRPRELVVVDDRPDPTTAPPVPWPALDGIDVRVVTSGGRGPAAARNRGWRATTAEWVVFVDDDVLLPPDWSLHLVKDLDAADGTGGGTARTGAVGGVQARIVVPLPDRRLSDAERGTAGLADALWATAEMAYRRVALHRVGGFDERFPRAFREDADLALRVLNAGFTLARGEREILHPLRPEDRRPTSWGGVWLSVTRQRGNADDALMRRLHGAGWRERARAPRGRLPGHVLSVAAASVAATTGTAAVLLSPRGRRAATARRAAVAAAALWAGVTAEFTARRVAPGPRDPVEVGTMALTSAALPWAAVRHRIAGTLRTRRAEPWPGDLGVVLFDRDGTLVHDVPYNGDPALVRPVAGAAEALDRLRTAGIKVGVVTNQSGIGRGLITAEQAAAVDARVRELLGHFDVWRVCPHTDADACACRKPQPGMVLDALAELGLSPAEAVVIGDIGADVRAATAAGAQAVLVPTAVTRPEEIVAAERVATTLPEAVDLVLDGTLRARREGMR